jgi:5-methylcytosine-specific restriction endonuclease McrA
MAKKAIEKPRNGGTMTESAFFSKIRSILRSGFRYWKPMQIVLNSKSRPYVGENKRQKKEYQCNKCKKWFKRSDVEIDHIIECGSLKTWEDIVPFIQRLTAESTDSFQILCKPDHLKKTKESKEIKS